MSIMKHHLVTHNMSRTRFYKIWIQLRSRCSNKTNKYYGARGITFSDEWNNFETFKTDMYDSYLSHVEKFGEKDTSLDRIDNDLGYSKHNCKWSTCSEQMSNRRHQVFCDAISPLGEHIEGLSITQLSNKYNIDHRKISDCLKGRRKTHKGWTFSYSKNHKKEVK